MKMKLLILWVGQNRKWYNQIFQTSNPPRDDKEIEVVLLKCFSEVSTLSLIQSCFSFLHQLLTWWVMNLKAFYRVVMGLGCTKNLFFLVTKCMSQSEREHVY